MSRVQWLDRTLLTSPYYIGLCKTPAAFSRELRRMKVPQDEQPQFLLRGANATAHAFEKPGDGKLCAIVCIGEHKKRTRHEINGLLVHEAMHVWRWVREHIGEREPSMEFEAYAVQHISQALMEAYWAKKQKK